MSPDPLDPQPDASAPADTLDLTKDDATRSAGAPPPPATTPYDLAQDQETARATIAYILLSLLGLVIVVSFWLLWAKPDHAGKLHELLQLVFAPLVALVGAATGYYFGAASAQQARK
ncbi:MAG TPA: hypothetical protein VMN81_04655 [Vicinamibacterales bacterium]|nr:hypothetical protein [Vicinamibacterales bacterium]